MTTNEFSWTTKDQLRIYGKEWKVDFPKAVIALIHGLGEHCNRYSHVAEFFAQHNIAMVGYDRSGHGQSEGQRGHTKSYEAFLEEVDELLKITKERYPVSPVFLYGHSMGGNILLKYLISRKPEVAGAISSGAFIEFPGSPPSVQIFIGKIVRKIYPSLSQSNNLSVDHVSSDRSVVEAYKKDPLVHDRLTPATGIGMIEVAQELEKYSGSLTVPTLIMHGSMDKLTGFDGSQKFAERVSGDVTFKAWEGMYHEMHNEPGKQAVFAFTLEWIRRYL
ncbi:MAG: lysophospholipase [Bacteroidota bacterium]